MHKSSILLTLLILGISLACNKVKETPEPDHFATTNLKQMEIPASGGETTIDVLGSNQINFQASVSLQPPRHGSLIPLLEQSRFLYRAHVGFEGIDTIPYSICRGTFCKSGEIRISVSNNPIPPCFPTYASNDTFFVRLTAEVGKVVYKLPLHLGDVYCKDNTRNIVWYPINLAQVQLLKDSIAIRPVDFPIIHSIQGSLRYLNCDTSNPPYNCKPRIIKYQIDTTKTYCHNLFKVYNRLIPLDMYGPSLSVTRNTFINMVESCQNDVDPYYFKITTSRHFIVQQTLDENRYIIRRAPHVIPPPTGPKYLKYYFRSRNLKLDSGVVQIREL